MLSNDDEYIAEFFLSVVLITQQYFAMMEVVTLTSDPIKLFTEDLRCDDMEVRVRCMRAVSKLAKAVGPERTRSELVPAMKNFLEEDDELLLLMAENLGKFVDLVGGAHHAVCLLEILEVLCGVEETVVRDMAVQSTCTIAAELSSSVVDQVLVPIIRRLSEALWFTSRVSSCALVANTYNFSTDPQAHQILRNIYLANCQDETPMVRRAAAAVFGVMVDKVEPEFLLSELLAQFKQLWNDESDSVRVLVIHVRFLFSFFQKFFFLRKKKHFRT